MDDGCRKRKSAKEIIFAPLILLNKGLSALLKKILKESYGEVTEDDILSMVDAGNENGTIEDNSVEMINNVFEFSDLKASDVMTHRVNIVGVDCKEGLDNIIYLALEKGFSRIPVYRDTIDNIIGIIIVKDLLCLIGKDNAAENFDLMKFLREVVYIPESCSCADTFKYLTNLKSGMAVVVDEYGGTAGIVTVEDLIEAIMGNIQDEYDEELPEIKPLGDNSYEVDGEADPEDVLDLFGYTLPDDHEYDTIAGFLTDLLGFIPEDVSDQPTAIYKDLQLTALETHDNCINRILVCPAPKNEEDENDKEKDKKDKK